MNLETVTQVLRPTSPEQVGAWRDGYAWLAGGTWLFSEPQAHLSTLIDLEALGWPPIVVTQDGLEIAATCRIAELHAFEGPPEWTAVPLFKACCDALLASHKVWNTATVGGNICMSLPAGAMTSLTSALEGVATLLPREGPPRRMTIPDFVVGNNRNVLASGELMRAIHLPASALRKRFAVRQTSRTHLGRSAALIIGTVAHDARDFRLTITAATPRPVQIGFQAIPSAAELRDAIDARIAADGYFDDVHGSAAYKRHLTPYFAEEIRAELARGEYAA